MSKTVPAFQRYRIKGFTDNHLFEEMTNESSTTSDRVTVEGAMGRVLNAIPRPHLSYYLYCYPTLSELAQRWPTFAFINPRTGIEQMKRIPIHLAPYIPEDLIGEEDDAKEILSEYQRQQSEQCGIAHVIQALEEDKEPDVLNNPLAMGVACHLFAGSRWLKSSREKIADVVCSSPASAYVALCSGAFNNNHNPLLSRIAEDPRLVLEISRSPVFAKLIKNDWFWKNLAASPVYYAAWLYLAGSAQAGYSILHSSAKKNSMSAAFCLGLNPHHAGASKWRKKAWEDNESIHWAAKMWITFNDDIAKFPHSGSACTRLTDDPRWYYHWLRDFETQELKNKLSLIWPSAWAAELIVDRGLSIDLVFDLCSNHKFELANPTEAALALWAADYTTDI